MGGVGRETRNVKFESAGEKPLKRLGLSGGENTPLKQGVNERGTRARVGCEMVLGTLLEVRAGLAKGVNERGRQFAKSWDTKRMRR